MLTLTVAEAGRGTRNASEAAKRIAPRILFLVFIDASLGTSFRRATRMPCRKSLNQRAFDPVAFRPYPRAVGEGLAPSRAPTRIRTDERRAAAHRASSAATAAEGRDM